MTTLIMTADKIGLPGLANWFKKLYAKHQERAMIKRTIKELSRLSDRELNDMGLARGDIWSVAHGDESYKERGVFANKNLRGWV
jgi:uncharacterized protein YjiS (DUF1127 family)